ncbi:hypothetical protein DPMN_026697 [Dreissena polymorpha]|uniref:Uncharacterized protein n=1 Tax=Dreissena polymorpha TaxID=45954 RepID=A0A9D4LRN3_DREPO|nr:hypothetical protein DPMN_026697 [Dreissena polymorpha]
MNIPEKFHQNWTMELIKPIHITKTAPPTGGHIFQRTRTTFELKQHIIKTDKTKLHEDWALNVTSTVFEPNRDIIGTNLLTKFHEDRTINVASRVFRNKCGQTDNGQRPVTKAHLSKKAKTAPSSWHPFLTKFHEYWAKNVTSRVFPCFHYKHIEKNAPPTGGHCLQGKCPPIGGHVFKWTGTTFELNQHIIKTNILTNFKLNRDFIGTKLLTKFHEDRTINVASSVYQQMLTDNVRRTKTGHKSSHEQSDFIKINILTKFHKDWMKTVTITVYTNKLLTINILTKFHKDWMNTATSIVYTSDLINILTKFHKEWMKTVTSTINILTKFHKDWMKTVTSTINILTKFHKDWMKTATSFVYTRFFYYLTDYINILTKFHKDWMKTVTYTVYTNKLLTDTRTSIRTPDITGSHKLTMSLLDR